MIDVRTPMVWTKPKSKIYTYNQEITGCYYQVLDLSRLTINPRLSEIKRLYICKYFLQPMLNYVESKERQGIFFEKPVEKIHLPEPAELALMDHTKYRYLV